MERALKQRIDTFFFADAHPLGLIAARTVLALQALWIVLSRPGMPLLTGWPAIFWNHQRPFLMRFAIVPGAVAVDRALYWLLIAALVAALFGILPRAACCISALLLYHFAPMEAVMAGLPYSASISGLTLPLIGLLILAFSVVPRLRDAPSSEYRWPLRLIQIVFVFHYLNSGLAKLHWAGIRWYSVENVRNLAVSFWMLDRPRLSLYAWEHRWFAAMIAIGVIAIEYGFVLTLLSKWAQRILLPLAGVAFALRASVFGFFFLSFPSLLVMVNWDAIVAWWQSRTATMATHPTA